MKKILIVFLAIGMLVPIAWASNMPLESPKLPDTPLLSEKQIIWLHALRWCESKGNDGAVNPKDKDGTPSYGRYQFKPGTFFAYGKRYGIDTSKGYRDAETQEAIVTQMIIRNDVKWRQQFPYCTRQLGTPPKLSTQ